jgi:hypothetical protein
MITLYIEETMKLLHITNMFIMKNVGVNTG